MRPQLPEKRMRVYACERDEVVPIAMVVVISSSGFGWLLAFVVNLTRL